MSVEFEPWPKIARLNRDITVTEKIDGTNAAILVLEDGTVAAQSRKRLITPESDNYGFAGWVQRHSEDIARLLGTGRHFGEWWGQGIQRRYGLDHKRFSLFNTARYGFLRDLESAGCRFDDGTVLTTVPVLYEGPYADCDIPWLLKQLDAHGSVAASGFEVPEGIVVFHQHANQMFKVTIKDDEVPKSLSVVA